MKKFIIITVIVCMLAGSGSASAFQPSIRINALSAVTLAQTEIALITLSLYIGAMSGNLDYFILASTAYGWYYFNYVLATWLPGINVTYQGAATTLTDYPLPSLSISGLPAGDYTFYFGVDSQDGVLNTSDPNFYYGSASLTVRPAF